MSHGVLHLLFGMMVCAGSVAVVSAASPPAGFIEVSPTEIKWRPHPVVKGGEIAVLVGSVNAKGPLVMRVKLPADARLMPHTHPDDRTYTVIAGEWKLGFGQEFSEESLRTYTAGSLYRLPARVAHFQAAGPMGAIVQIESIGPTSTDLVK